MTCSELEGALRRFRELNGDLEVCYDDAGRIMDVDTLSARPECSTDGDAPAICLLL